MNLSSKKILLTGGAGFLGRFVYKKLLKEGCSPDNIFIPRSQEDDLRKLENCQRVAKNIDIVIHLAAKVGGIGFNLEKPGELFYDNLIMGAQLMEEARKEEVEKFVAIGTVCAYPKYTPVPAQTGSDQPGSWDGRWRSTPAPVGGCFCRRARPRHTP